mgnify:CR=1 FL=1
MVLIVQVQVEALPICVFPLFVTSSMVAVKDFRLAIALRSVVRSAEVRVMVRDAVPAAHVRPVRDR